MVAGGLGVQGQSQLHREFEASLGYTGTHHKETIKQLDASKKTNCIWGCCGNSENPGEGGASGLSLSSTFMRSH